MGNIAMKTFKVKKYRYLVLITVIFLLVGSIFTGCATGEKPQDSESKSSETIKTIISTEIEPSEKSQTYGSEDTILITIPGNFLEETEELTVTETDNPVSKLEFGMLEKTFSISLGDIKDFEEILVLEIPYDEGKITGESKAANTFVGLYFDEESNKWEEAVYDIDENKQMVVIYAMHLSDYGIGRADYDDISSPLARVKTSYYYPQEIYSLDKIKSIISEYDENGEKPGYEAISAGWDIATECFGIGSTAGGFAEEVLDMSSFSNINTIAGEMGLGLALLQLAIDIDTEEPAPAVLTFSKDLGSYALGKWGTKALKISSIGIFIIDYSLGKFGETAVTTRDQLYENAYKLYYTDKSIKGKVQPRRPKDWYKIIYNIASNASSQEDVKQLLEKELDEYVNAFWEDNDGMLWAFSETKQGFTYSAGEKKSLEKQISENHKSEIINGYLKVVIPQVAKRIRVEQMQAFRENALKKMAAELNKVYTIKVTVKGEKEEIKNLPVRIITENNQEYWTGETDDKGEWQMKCTLYGYMNAGLPDRAELTIPATEAAEERTLEASFIFNDSGAPAEIVFNLEDDISGMWKGEMKKTQLTGTFTYTEGDKKAVYDVNEMWGWWLEDPPDVCAFEIKKENGGYSIMEWGSDKITSGYEITFEDGVLTIEMPGLLVLTGVLEEENLIRGTFEMNNIIADPGAMILGEWWVKREQ